MKSSIFTLLSVLVFLWVACSSNEEKVAQDDKGQQYKDLIIKANDEMINQGNLAFADEVFADEYAGKGPSTIKEMVAGLRTVFPDIQVTIDPMIAEGNKAAWLRTHTGTHSGEIMGFQPTGEKITWKTMIISEYDEQGKVVKEWGVSDLHEVLQRKKTENAVQE